MRKTILAIFCLLFVNSLRAQVYPIPAKGLDLSTGNIYTIRQQYLEKVLHNPLDKNNTKEDNDLERFNRWFNFVEPRCYPSGNLPKPDVLVNTTRKANKSPRTARTTSASTWYPLGPVGMGRVDCIVIDPIDHSTIYVGAACGGVWISHDGGTTWTSNTDNFPSLSVGDIAVNPQHTDTLYAATGDGFAYIPGSESAFNIFWGGLYSAGVMQSTDGGSSWHTTGLTYLQPNNAIIQKLLIHPNNPNILLAATRHGILRTTDAGATWNLVDTGHVFSMAFHSNAPDTIYAVNTSDLRVSYDAGATWSLLYSGINTTGGRCTIATSKAAPKAVWIMTDQNLVATSHDEGHTFPAISADPTAITSFYGYYDRVIAVSPADSNNVIVAGMLMATSPDGGGSWNYLDPAYMVHPDNHAVVFDDLNPNIIFSGNDGGLFMTNDGGNTWTDLSNQLSIAQIYRMSSSRQNPYLMLCGLQDNGTLYNNGTFWDYSASSAGDGMDCLIYPGDDNIQLTSYQYGNFFLSTDQGFSFINLTEPEVGNWTTPAVFSPYSPDTIYFGYNNMYVSYDMGFTYHPLTIDSPFAPHGVVSLAIGASNSSVLYAANLGHIMRTTDKGTTWTDVTAGLPGDSLAIIHIALNYTDPFKVYVSISGYTDGKKLYYSSNGGATWTNISSNLPNLPVNCVVLDSSTPGAIFVGTDMGVYYTDSSLPNWIPYNAGLPNVIVNDLEINYTNYRLRAATYGRGIWETNLRKIPLSVPAQAYSNSTDVLLAPNPSGSSWNIHFTSPPANGYQVRLADYTGRVLYTGKNSTEVPGTGLPCGIYTIQIEAGTQHYSLKAVKN